MDAVPENCPTFQEPHQRGLRFNPEVNAGHLLTMLTMTGTIVAMWFSFDKRLAITELVVTQMKDQIVATSATLKQIADTQQTTVQTVDKLAFIVDEIRKRKP